MVKVKAKKVLPCPNCGLNTVYHRTKTNDNVCVRCGTIFNDRKEAL